MSTKPPLSLAAVAVLKAIADGSRYGFDIMDAAQLPSGTVYPILGRLARDGHVTASWERVAVARKAKRPPRKYYTITPRGAARLRLSMYHYQTLGGRVTVRSGRAAKEST